MSLYKPLMRGYTHQGCLLRKPPLKCARSCPTWLAYPLGMLTQHEYVAPPWTYGPVQASVCGPKAHAHLRIYVWVACNVPQGSCIVPVMSPILPLCACILPLGPLICIRNALKKAEKAQKSAIFVHFSSFFCKFLQFSSKKCKFLQKNVNFFKKT